jgi:hypothetical protein
MHAQHAISFTPVDSTATSPLINSDAQSLSPPYVHTTNTPSCPPRLTLSDRLDCASLFFFCSSLSANALGISIAKSD